MASNKFKKLLLTVLFLILRAFPSSTVHLIRSLVAKVKKADSLFAYFGKCFLKNGAVTAVSSERAE
jgi:hypothetical protein